MTDPVPALKPSRLIKPTLETPYHVDYGWWDKADRNLRVYLKSHLCALHRDMYSESSVDTTIDWVDSYTAEVRTHCSQQPDYITNDTSVVDAVFRVFLVNDNHPLSPRELAERIGKDPELILKTISGKTVYKGLRPVVEGAA
jgi:hypothetical protein